MDELLIEERRYISSKRAAKATGYAKDYVGQLCREGRVPARLIGRNWYVLESAIQDHRFGTPEKPTKRRSSKEKAKKEDKKEKIIAEDSPQYEALELQGEEFPINLIKKPEILKEEASIVAEKEEEAEKEREIEEKDREEEEEYQQKSKDSWQEWADRFERVSHAVEKEEEKSEEELPATPVSINSLPIRTQYLFSKEELGGEVVKRKEKREKRGTTTIIKLIAGSFALAAVILAVINSGHFDNYFKSVKRDVFFSGVIVYNK